MYGIAYKAYASAQRAHSPPGERLIWIRPSVINSGSALGAVMKDYQLNKSPD